MRCIDETARYGSRCPAQYVYNTTNVGQFPAGKDKVGRIDAISVETGKTMWSWETRARELFTAARHRSGLLFNGGFDRFLRAHDADNRPGGLANAASVANGRWGDHLFRQRAANTSRLPPAAAVLPDSRWA
jgi:hypothetical protein